MFSDHLKSCEYCQKGSYQYIGRAHLSSSKPKPTIRIKSASSYAKDKKPTIYVKSASSYRKERKLTELGAIIRGTSFPPISIPVSRTKGASFENNFKRPGPIEREVKLKQLGKLIRG